jgi:hypothetical protein
MKTDWSNMNYIRRKFRCMKGTHWFTLYIFHLCFLYFFLSFFSIPFFLTSALTLILFSRFQLCFVFLSFYVALFTLSFCPPFDFPLLISTLFCCRVSLYSPLSFFQLKKFPSVQSLHFLYTSFLFPNTLLYLPLTLFLAVSCSFLSFSFSFLCAFI